MKIRVLYFAVLRERINRGEELLALAAGATVGQLVEELERRHPPVRALRRHLQIARNRELVRLTETLCDGDEVALIPPVAGGATAAVRGEPLDLGEAVRLVTSDTAGALVTFAGIVRRSGAQIQRVERLEYEAYTAMAEARLAEITAQLEHQHGAKIAILHRVGRLAVGETAVVIAVAAPHRAEAFAACREAIERLKVEVPIWKKEIGEDGEEWIGMGP